MTPTLAFDIETVPDTEGLRKLYGLGPEETSASIAEIAFHRRRQQTGGDFLPLHLHRVIAIACALRDGDQLRVWSLGNGSGDEKELIQRFFDGIENYTPQLISWNGGGFDLPVLHYRSLVHGVTAARYWETGDDDRDFKWNSYISRYHTRHLDLMDLLALFQPRASVPLDELAQLIGLPGKLGMDGSKVWDAYCRGELAAIRRYCETDVANTYLVYLRFQLMRGCCTPENYQREVDLVKATLGASNETHWQEFMAKWNASTSAG
ncbi:MAG: 3'-5' exonuclease [Burkholderiales bacterium]|nr:3'-5' exonuclease [Burkholderiales bacterium]